MEFFSGRVNLCKHWGFVIKLFFLRGEYNISSLPYQCNLLTLTLNTVPYTNTICNSYVNCRKNLYQSSPFWKSKLIVFERINDCGVSSPNRHITMQLLYLKLRNPLQRKMQKNRELTDQEFCHEIVPSVIARQLLISTQKNYYLNKTWRIPTTVKIPNYIVEYYLGLILESDKPFKHLREGE